MSKKKGYWSWWWDNNAWWIIIFGIIIAAVGAFFLLIYGAIFLANILPKWVQICIAIGGLIVCISLLIAGSYWNYQDETTKNPGMME